MLSRVVKQLHIAQLLLHIEVMSVATPRRTWLQYEGASPHFARAVTEYLKDLEEDGKEEVDRWLGLLGLPT
jgi:hypothetical protein